MKAKPMGKVTHEVRVGMSVYWAETWPVMRLACGEPTRGHDYSAIDGKVGGWCPGTRSQALAELREALRAREALHAIALVTTSARPGGTAMGDRADCPNCGAEVRGVWVYPNGEDSREGMHTVASDDYHFRYACPGSFESGAAVAFGLLGMAEAIRARDDDNEARPCSYCGARPYHLGMGCPICNRCRSGRDRSNGDG